LVRLHALERQWIGGADLGPSAKSAGGFAQCERGPLRHDWDFLHRTTCTNEHARSAFRLSVPHAVADAHDGNWVVISVRRTDATSSAPIELHIGDRINLPLEVDGGWIEARFPLPKGALNAGQIRAELRVPAGVRVQLDHVLLVPRVAGLPEAHG
jgi:hypothetical protein